MTLLPPNVTPIERALESTMARLADIPVPLRALYDPDTCPPDLLPYLAWALSIDTWSTGWPDEVKRARVRSAIAIQRRKGTARSVRDVVQSFGGEVAIREWWEMQPLGTPHTFSLVLDLDGRSGALTSAAYVEQVVAEVARTKPVRSHFTFTQALAATSALRPIAVIRPIVFVRLQTIADPAPVFLSFSFTNGALPAGVAVRRALGPWVRRSETGAVEKATTANVPRFDYDPPIENRILRSSAPSASLFIANATMTATQIDAVITKYVQGAVGAGGYAFDYFDSGNAGIGLGTYSVDIRGAVGGEILWVLIQKSGSGTTYRRVVLTTAWQRFDLSSADTRYAGFGVRRLGDTGPDEASAAQTYYVRRRQLNKGAFALGYADTDGAAVFMPAFCRGVMLEPSGATSDGIRPTESLAVDVPRGATGAVDLTYSDGSTETRAGTITGGVLTLPASAMLRIVSRVRVNL